MWPAGIRSRVPCWTWSMSSPIIHRWSFNPISTCRYGHGHFTCRNAIIDTAVPTRPTSVHIWNVSSAHSSYTTLHIIIHRHTLHHTSSYTAFKWCFGSFVLLTCSLQPTTTESPCLVLIRCCPPLTVSRCCRPPVPVRPVCILVSRHARLPFV